MLYQGVTGKISIKKGAGAEQFLAHMTTWSVDMSMSIDETAYFGGSATEEGFTEKTPGVGTWTASANGAADFGTASGQKDLLQAHFDKAVVTATFYLDATTGMQGEAIIESLSISHAADGKGEISISLSGNGKPTMLS